MLKALSILILAGFAHPQPKLPDCFPFGEPLVPLDNGVVLKWKKEQSVPFSGPAFVRGRFQKYRKPGDWEAYRFQLQIGPSREDTIVISHNPLNSTLPKLKKGDEVVACGVFILSPKIQGGAGIVNTSMSPNQYSTDGFLIVHGKILD